MDDVIALVQFIHPGKECTPKRRADFIPWNHGDHKRKFLYFSILARAWEKQVPPPAARMRHKRITPDLRTVVTKPLNLAISQAYNENVLVIHQNISAAGV